MPEVHSNTLNSGDSFKLKMPKRMESSEIHYVINTWSSQRKRHAFLMVSLEPLEGDPDRTRGVFEISGDRLVII